MSWRINSQEEFEGKQSGFSFLLPAVRGARNFTVGSGSDEESFPPVSLSRRNPRSSRFPYAVTSLAQKAANSLLRQFFAKLLTAAKSQQQGLC